MPLQRLLHGCSSAVGAAHLVTPCGPRERAGLVELRLPGSIDLLVCAGALLLTKSVFQTSPCDGKVLRLVPLFGGGDDEPGRPVKQTYRRRHLVPVLPAVP